MESLLKYFCFKGRTSLFIELLLGYCITELNIALKEITFSNRTNYSAG